ncbi:MAG: isoleucyl-tRNA synthetase, partial [Pseudomonadota bacterium]
MDYKTTLLLPETAFPMRGSLPQTEPIRIKKWQDDKVYEKLTRKNSADFTLHDGPPYANGHLHIGHALNKTLKDIIVKLAYFSGKSVRFTPGWDCHGLPIEQEVEKALGKEKKDSIGKPATRELCRAHAKKFVDIQKEEFIKMGVIADFDKPYVTMDFAFEANIYRSLVEIAKQGVLTLRKKPVYWSWAARTALAEAEVEYKDKEDYSLFVAFELLNPSLIGVEKASIVIWTTTPWTLPANSGISLNPDALYALTSDGFVVAESLVEKLKANEVISGDVVKTFSAKVFERAIAKNPLNGRDSIVVLGSHVMIEDGTGAVHTAPGHGEDDYRVGLVYDLPVIMPVDENGRYDETIIREKLLPEEFLGAKVLQSNDKIVEMLGSAALKVGKFIHSYPHCWRTNQPVIYRATEQWFIAMDAPLKRDGRTLRQTALGAIERVKFTPETGYNRLRAMIANRPDWCVSRQRDWGVPIAFFRHKATGEVLYDEAVLNKTAAFFEAEGCDTWYIRPNADFGVSDEYEKTADILDVWFDSGSTWFSVLKSGNYDAGNFPADVYL